MMKTITILVAIALSVPQLASGGALNGVSWERMAQSDKIILLTGYINGFRLGTVHGADFGIETTSKYMKELSSSSVYGVKIFKDYWKCGTLVDKNREAMLDAAARYGRNALNQPVEYYVEDVDSFYRKYPSCKERELMEMLRDISLVWLMIRTYKDIGKECSDE